MFARNAEPIANVPVYKRIPINEATPDPNAGRCNICGSRGMEDYCAREYCPASKRLTPAECERIWDLIKSASEGNGG